MKRVLVALLLFFSSGCSPFHPGPEAVERTALHRVAEVPFRAQQTREDCGPAALASVLAHRGRHIDPATIARTVYSPKLGGTLLPDLENYAADLGFATRSGRGDLDLLRRSIDAGRPVVVLIETGMWVVSRPHYLVVHGYDPEGFLVHAGTRKNVYIENEVLASRWRRMNRLYLYLQ